MYRYILDAISDSEGSEDSYDAASRLDRYVDWFDRYADCRVISNNADILSLK